MLVFLNRMALQANPDSFLVELTPLSQALIGAIHSGVHLLAQDISDTMSAAEIKQNFLFGGSLGCCSQKKNQ